MISNLDANSACVSLIPRITCFFNHRSGSSFRHWASNLFSSATCTILPWKGGEGTADDGAERSEDRRGKFTHQKRVSLKLLRLTILSTSTFFFGYPRHKNSTVKNCSDHPAQYHLQGPLPKSITQRKNPSVNARNSVSIKPFSDTTLLTHHKNSYGETKSLATDIVKDVARGAWWVASLWGIELDQGTTLFGIGRGPGQLPSGASAAAGTTEVGTEEATMCDGSADDGAAITRLTNTRMRASEEVNPRISKGCQLGIDKG